MTAKARIRKAIGAWRKLSLVALLAMVFTAAPTMAVQADGSTQCPIPQKRNNAMKESKPSADTRAARPPIDLLIPGRTETATFAMG